MYLLEMMTVLSPVVPRIHKLGEEDMASKLFTGLNYSRADFPFSLRKLTITKNFDFKKPYYPNPKCSETSKRKSHS